MLVHSQHESAAKLGAGLHVCSTHACEQCQYVIADEISHCHLTYNDVGLDVHISKSWLLLASHLPNAYLPAERQCFLMPETVCRSFFVFLHQRLCDNAVAITHLSPAVSWTTQALYVVLQKHSHTLLPDPTNPEPLHKHTFIRKSKLHDAQGRDRPQHPGSRLDPPTGRTI